jgi:uncharacterized membrane protein
MDPFRRALLRGLAVLLPPLLTIVILVWIWNTVANYLLVPMEAAARRILVSQYEKSVLPASTTPDAIIEGVALINGNEYRQTADGRYVPADYYDRVAEYVGPANVPGSSTELNRVYVDYTFLQRHVVVPVFLCVFLLVLYLLGKFMAAGVGRFFWLQFERVITRLPLVRNVYSSVKQVTDFVFSEREIEYTRVVAVEYPRKGIWQLAFVTGESLIDVAAAANESTLTVFFPCSPMPFTGFTATVKRSETLDLNVTTEQAIQYLVSCGVVSPKYLSGPPADRATVTLPPPAAGA